LNVTTTGLKAISNLIGGSISTKEVAKLLERVKLKTYPAMGIAVVTPANARAPSLVAFFKILILPVLGQALSDVT
jgi:hypothetical protein